MGKLLLFSLLLAAYFLTLFLLHYYDVRITMVGVFQELLTIPMILAQLVLLGFIVARLLNKHRRTRADFLAGAISCTTTFFIFQSLFQ